MQIIYAKSAAKIINTLEKGIKQRIKRSIEGLTQVPPIGDIKQLQGYNPITYRLRIGKYRILYEYNTTNEEQVLFIKDIGSRGDIYKWGDDYMSTVSKQIVDMVNMLPESEQQLAFEFIKRMVLAWDSDFTKLTPFERDKLTKADAEIINGETIDHSEIDWN